MGLIPGIDWDYTKLTETIDTLTGAIVRRRAQHVILFDSVTGAPAAPAESTQMAAVNAKLADVFPPGVSTLDVPVQVALTIAARSLMAAGQTCRSMQIQAIRPDGTPNVGMIAIGTVTRQTIYVAPGDFWNDSAPLGKVLDLSQIFVRSLTAGDFITLVTRS